MIWHKPYDIPALDAMITAREGNILLALGIEYVEIGPDFLKMKMPVDKRTHQVHGILHGGATCVLAETVGSLASLMVVDLDHRYAVGSVITANHLRPVKDGFVTATARPVHLGRSKHVWDIMVNDDAGRLIAKCDLTCAVTDKNG